MQLRNTGQVILQQLYDLISQLGESEYGGKLELLHDNSIGQHARHIMEFFDILIQGSKNGIINYDHRQHTPIYETDINEALIKLNSLMKGVEMLPLGTEVLLEVGYGETDLPNVQLKSSLDRELAYNIEHGIHHMAIIKIAIQTVFPDVQLSHDFGVAYSTIRYRKTLVK